MSSGIAHAPPWTTRTGSIDKAEFSWKTTDQSNTEENEALSLTAKYEEIQEALCELPVGRHHHLLHDLGKKSIAFCVNRSPCSLLKLAGTLFLIEVIHNGRHHTANFLAKSAEMHQAVHIECVALQFRDLSKQLLNFTLPAIQFGFILYEILGIANDQQLERFQISRRERPAALQFRQERSQVHLGQKNGSRLNFEFLDLVAQSAITVAGFNLGRSRRQVKC